MATGKQICEAWARRQLGDRADAAEVAAYAERFWRASPSGELAHVFVAASILEEEGLLPARQGGGLRVAFCNSPIREQGRTR